MKSSYEGGIVGTISLVQARVRCDSPSSFVELFGMKRPRDNLVFFGCLAVVVCSLPSFRPFRYPIHFCHVQIDAIPIEGTEARLGRHTRSWSFVAAVAQRIGTDPCPSRGGGVFNLAGLLR